MSTNINQFQNYLKNKSLSALTIRGYVFDAAQFVEWSENNSILLSCVTPENASQYLDYLVTSLHEIRPGVFGEYSSRTITKKIAGVRSFFDFLGAVNE